MPTEAQLDAQRKREANLARQRAAAIERETEAALRKASTRSRRAVAAVLMEQRENARSAITSVARAWSRAPSAVTAAAIANGTNSGWSKRAGRGASRPLGGSADPRHTTFHFKLNETHDGGAARAHQRYIEREPACIATMGNLADTQAERERLWEAIAERGVTKKGSLRLDFTDSAPLAREVLNALPQWSSEGLIPARAARAVAVRARKTIQESAADAASADAQIPEPEAAPEATLEPEEDEGLTSSAKRSRRLRAKANPEHSVTLWTRSREAHYGVQEQMKSWLPSEEQAKRMRSHRPRETIIQRRMVLELAHELDDEARERALETWCENTLGRGASDGMRPSTRRRTTTTNATTTPTCTPSSASSATRRARAGPSRTPNTCPRSTTPSRCSRATARTSARAATRSFARGAPTGPTCRTTNSQLSARRSATTPGRTATTAARTSSRAATGARCKAQSRRTKRNGSASPHTWPGTSAWKKSSKSRSIRPGPTACPSRCATHSTRRACTTDSTTTKRTRAKTSRRRSTRFAREAIERDPESVEARAAAWLRALRDDPQRLLDLKDPPEFERWKEIERTVHDTSQRAVLAHGIVSRWPEEAKRASQLDPRPAVRRLRSEARRAEAIRTRWSNYLLRARVRLAPAIFAEEHYDELLRHLDESGVTLNAAFGRDTARDLAVGRAMAIAEGNIHRLAEAILTGASNDECADWLRLTMQRTRRTLTHLNAKDQQHVKDRFDLLSTAIDIRRQFQDATLSATAHGSAGAFGG